VAVFGSALALIRLVAASQRVLGWILAAAAIAGLLEPAVRRLQRRMPRGAAAGLVAVITLATVGFIAYRTVDEIVAQSAALQEAAPRRARALERSERFGDFAREVKLAERTERFVDGVPARLRGGSPADAIRSATTRGVSYLATTILALFFLLHGPRIARAAALQVRSRSRRLRLESVAEATFRRGFGYARGSIGMAAGAGLLAFVMARAADVPGAAPLALWVAVWDLVPLMGVFVGGLPIVVLAGVESAEHAVFIGAAFLGYQILEAVFLQRPLHRRTVKVGPFVTTAVGMIGLELYGIGGALMGVLVAALVAALADELAPPAEGESAAAADGGEVGPVL
jgi:predicted PurR-regulated permease PerM